MRAILPLCALLALAGCGEGAPASEAPKLDLQRIGAPEMEQYDIYGNGCVFVPEGGGISAIFITDDAKAYIRPGGKVVKLAKVEGSAELPSGAWQDYAGENYSVSLTISGTGNQRATEVTDYAGHFTVRDATGAELYKADGLARCGA